LNILFSFWLDKFYNQKFHSATKQSPLSRWEGDSHPVKRPAVDTVREAFLWKDERTVSLTGIISVNTNQYEVEPFLCGKKLPFVTIPMIFPGELGFSMTAGNLKTLYRLKFIATAKKDSRKIYPPPLLLRESISWNS